MDGVLVQLVQMNVRFVVGRPPPFCCCFQGSSLVVVAPRAHRKKKKKGKEQRRKMKQNPKNPHHTVVWIFSQSFLLVAAEQTTKTTTTMSHDPSTLKDSLEMRGALLKAYQCRLNIWRRANGDADMEAWPRTPEQLKAANLEEASASDLEALKELDQKTGSKNKKEEVDEKDLQSRIFQLTKGTAGGGGSNPLPKAPSNLTALICEPDPLAGNNVPYEKQDAKYFQKHYPQLNLETAQALLEYADEGGPDHYPKHVLVDIGAHYVDQNWTVSELQQWCSSFAASGNKAKTELTSKERAELYGTLAFRVLKQMYKVSDLMGEMIDMANFLQDQPLADLKRDLEQEGLEAVGGGRRQGQRDCGSDPAHVRGRLARPRGGTGDSQEEQEQGWETPSGRWESLDQDVQAPSRLNARIKYSPPLRG